MFNSDTYLVELFDSVIRTEADLESYQNYAVEWLKDRPYSALYIDVGMGKTVIILTLLDWLIYVKGYDGKILVIAPIKVVNRVWMYEHTLWEHTSYLPVHNLRIEDDDARVVEEKNRWYKTCRRLGIAPENSVKIAGHARQRRKTELRVDQLNNKAKIHLVNQEAVAWLVSRFIKKKNKKTIEFRKWPYQIVIFDESSRLRDHRSEIFNALKSVRHRIYRFHELTATPAPQTYEYLFSQIWLLDKGDRFGDFVTHFRSRYFTENPYSKKRTLRPGGAEAIEEKIADICLVMRKDGEAKPTIVQRPIRLSKPMMQKYRQFRDTMILETNETEIEAVHGGALSLKLLQLTSGAVYDETGRYHILHDEKIDDLRELSEETLDQPILVAYWFKPSLARLRKAFPKALVMDKQGKMEAEWNTGQHKMMLIHPASAAHGLNLQFGGHHLAIFDMFWSLELFLQTIGRLWRKGQTDPVIVHLLSMIGTEDRIVSDNLAKLEDAQEAFFTRLRQLHRKIRGR